MNNLIYLINDDYTKNGVYNADNIEYVSYYEKIDYLKYKNGGLIPNTEVEKLNYEVLTLLANYFNDNIRDLEGALRTYVNYCKCMELPFDENSVYLALESVLPKKELEKDSNQNNISNVRDIVCKYFNITQNDIDSNSRKAQFVYARQIIMYFLKNKYGLTLKNIGANLGNKDYTTVLHGIDKIETALKTNDLVKMDVENIEKKLNN